MFHQGPDNRHIIVPTSAINTFWLIHVNLYYFALCFSYLSGHCLTWSGIDVRAYQQTSKATFSSYEPYLPRYTHIAAFLPF
jgi:hypothetical protein